MTDNWVTVTGKKKAPKKPISKPWSEHVKSVATDGQFPESETTLEMEVETQPQQIPEKKHGSQGSQGSQGVHKLQDTWVIWSHEIKGSTANDWTIKGYDQLIKFNTIEDFWIIYNNLTDITGKMYYLMRDGYVPLWDSDENINGGAWTFKIDKKQLANFWRDLSCYCIGETICERSEKIVGLSLSPKIRYATVRVWTADTSKETMMPDQFKKVLEETVNSDVIIDFRNARFTKNTDAST